MNEFNSKVIQYLHSFDNDSSEVEEIIRILNDLDFQHKSSPEIQRMQGVLNIAIYDLNLYSTSILAILAVIFGTKITKSYSKKLDLIVSGYHALSTTPIELIYKNKDGFFDFILISTGDLRAALIGLAFNFYHLRNPETEKKRIQTISFSREVFIPLCHRLGFYRIKSEMEDLVFAYTNPKIFNELKAKIEGTSSEREKFIKEFIRPISRELEEHKLNFKIKSRTKSISSIYSKMVKQDIPFERVFDLFAIRIISDSQPQKEISDCWHVFSVVTNIYKSDTKRLRDWISKPRENGYESLHITVETSEKRYVEVQIRSTRMDDEAENGMAAHWRYKGGKSDALVNNYLLKIRQALENNKLDDETFSTTNSSLDLFAFTPTGELKKLKQGATVLDFAFSIHSEVGIRCSGARINGKLKQIKQSLINGDRVEIITSRNQKPTLDWLNYVRSSKAKARIRKAVDEQKMKEAEDGKEILHRRLRNWKLEFNQELLEELATNLKTKSITDIYRDVYLQKIDILDIKKILSNRLQPSVKTEDIEPKEAKVLKSTGNSDLIIDENDYLNYKLAACCHPVPGDAIFGFVTVSKGITIHREDCPNSKSLTEHYPYRILPAKWKRPEEQNRFRAELYIKGWDRPGVMSEITKIISSQASLLQLNMHSIGKYFQGKITVGIQDAGQLKDLISKLTAQKDLLEIYRIGG